MALFLDFIVFYYLLCLSLCQYYTILIFIGSVSFYNIKFHLVLLQKCLAILKSSDFQIKFRVSLSIAVKISDEIVIGIALNPYINLGKINILEIENFNEPMNYNEIHIRLFPKSMNMAYSSLM